MADRSAYVGFGFGSLLAVLCYLQGWVWFPNEFTWETYALFATSAAVTVIYYLNEYQQLYPLQYSKFSPDGNVPARVGWFIIYFTPALTYILLWTFLGAPTSKYDVFILTLYCVHFFKRCMEVCFVHKYSKGMVLPTIVEITTLYSLGAIVTCYSTHVMIGPVRHTFLHDTIRVKVGIAVYTFGQLCNFTHHVILASLREPGSARYVIPTGGFFGFVLCPQYFGELMSWLGFSIAGYSFGLYLSYIPMMVYLVSRSHHTYYWYKAKFEDYPAQHTLKLWPFIY